MKPFADTNWVSSLYFRSDFSDISERRQRTHDVPIFVSRPVLYECSTLFPWKSEQANPPELADLAKELGSAIIMTRDSWDDIERKAREIAGRYAHKIRIGAGDTMIVASAVLSGCDWFYSFDTNSHCRALAALCKLKVFPELAAADKAAVARAS